MKFNKLIMLFILYFSLEILYRRWALGSIPTPVSREGVYGLLLVNLVAILWIFRPADRRKNSR